MINFPDTPTLNQTFTAAGVVWVWDGTKWNMSSVAGGAFISISNSPPASPIVGNLWWDSVGGQLYIYFNDGSSSQWVTVTNQGFGGLYLPLQGGHLTGPLTLAADPTVALGAATKEYVDAIPPNYPLNDNLIINGDMFVAQRGVTFTPTAVGSNYTLDRWTNWITQGSKGSVNRGAGGPNAIQLGIGYFLSYTSLSSYTLLANDQFLVSQAIEADLISGTCWGTPGAQPVTLSFWATSNSTTGLFSGCIQSYAQGANTRSYPFTFNIPITGQWYKFTITIPGDTVGPWTTQGVSNGGLWLSFDMGSGANLRTVAANQWSTGVYNGVTGTNSLVSTNGANIFISNVKLELGSVATEFNRYTPTKKLSDCQRYYQGPGVILLVSGYNIAGGNVYLYYNFPTTMRVAPTITASGTVYSNASGLSFPQTDPYGCRATCIIGVAGAGNSNFNYQANAEL
jgi:hypothetical protein